ncbi:hypothetical protein [Georgenia ruanii]|uniref:hypothetical protein n=1 Tax=Georgenia ruanii TaxID=348442 RepID=UPI00186B4C2A|nr:hypothetical protein [Georgenia ruanii]
MDEGLTPAEAAEATEELRRRQILAGERGEMSRVILILEAGLLSVVTVITAWAGYSAARWSTEQRSDFAEASIATAQAARAIALATELRNFDASTFNAWFTAFTLGDPDKMQVAERRFRPEFRVAFDAWRATNPDTNPDAPAGPTYMPEYRQPEQERGDRLDAAAEAHLRAGYRDGEVADNYVRITVLLASVLFLVGIGTTFKLKTVRYGLVAVGGLLLVTALIQIAQQPFPA